MDEPGDRITEEDLAKHDRIVREQRRAEERSKARLAAVKDRLTRVQGWRESPAPPQPAPENQRGVIGWRKDSAFGEYRVRLAMHEELAHISNPLYIVANLDPDTNLMTVRIPDSFLEHAGEAWAWLRGYSGRAFFLISGLEAEAEVEVQLGRGICELIDGEIM